MLTTAIDTETFLILPGVLAPPLVCLTWARDGESGLVHHSDPELHQWVMEALLGHTVFANAPFDLAVLAHKWPNLIPLIFDAFDNGRVHDIQLREKLIDLAAGTFRFEEDEHGDVIAKGYSLAEITARRLGRWLDKDTWRMRYHDLHAVPLEQWPAGATEYATTDAEVTLAIYLQQEGAGGALANQVPQEQAAWALHLMSAHGIRTDAAAVEALREQTKLQIEELRTRLIGAGLVRADGSRDTKAAARRMLAVSENLRWTDKGEEKKTELGLPTLMSLAATDGKYVSLNEESCNISGDAILKDYAAYNKAQNMLTGSIEHFSYGTTVPIQSRFQSLMETGRTSSSSPNIQNIRRVAGIRECFVPREGNVFAACDYSAAELHTLAQFCIDQFGHSKLADALNDGIDVHAWLGCALMGIPYKEYDEKNEEHEHARQVSKACNFGMPGGCSAATFVAFAAGYGLELDVRDGARIKQMWFDTWPEMHEFFEFVSSKCDNGEGWYYMWLPRSKRLRNRCSYTAACNTAFQGPASDGAKAALYALTREQWLDEKSPLYGTRCVNFIHDEIIVETPEAVAHDVAMRMQIVMEREFNRFVPDVPTKANPVLMRRWHKKAKPIFENGRLVPWEG